MRGVKRTQKTDEHEPVVEGLDRVVRVGDLVGTVEIARRVGVGDHNVVNTWRYRHADFPEPVVTLRHARVWSWVDVEHWAQRTGRLPS
jgi:uncharacterized linocin/CFP29 family protein